MPSRTSTSRGACSTTAPGCRRSFQLGTVWLPLPHILMLPFVWNKALWMSGIAGSIASMVAYVLGALGIFRLVSARAPQIGSLPGGRHLRAQSEPALHADHGDERAALPGVLHLGDRVFRRVAARGCQRTGQLRRALRPERALEGCGIALAGGAATRYDGWFFGALMGVLVLWTFARWWRATPDAARRRSMTKSLVEFLLLNALVPVFWLAYNHRVSGRAMDWANGPYSARAIAERTTARGAAPYPGQGPRRHCGPVFPESRQTQRGARHTGATCCLCWPLLGTAVALWRFRQYRTWLLLWVPLVFYALSIAYGSVPIFIPTWWPFSYYNVRYGLELLPVFAVFPALLAFFWRNSLIGQESRSSSGVLLGAAGGSQLPVGLCRSPDYAERGAG